jgi:hypothetical protein
MENARPVPPVNPDRTAINSALWSLSRSGLRVVDAAGPAEFNDLDIAGVFAGKATRKLDRFVQRLAQMRTGENEAAVVGPVADDGRVDHIFEPRAVPTDHGDKPDAAPDEPLDQIVHARNRARANMQNNLLPEWHF